MEIAEPRKRGRYKRRTTPRDETAQTSPFPSDPSPQAADNLEQDAAEKEKVKKAAAAIPEIFTPEQVVWVFDAYVAILSFVYSLALKTDFSAIQKELEFSTEQKEGLAKPLAKICSKYAPSEWAGATAEIQLITMLGVWTVASFQRAKNVARAEEEKKKDAERTQPVQPIRAERPVREVHV
jgi:hypothetical protein